MALSGEIDIGTVAEVEEAGKRILATMRDLVLDLRGVTFMDSSGVMLLVQLDALARRRGVSFWAVGGNPTIERILRSAGVEQYIAVLDIGDDVRPGPAARSGGARTQDGDPSD
jgi:anti-anti-sigma factor